MNSRSQELQKAFQLLGLSSEDTVQTAKIKFRKLMRKYHPDAIGSDARTHVERAQRLNAAYELVLEALSELKYSAEKHSNRWNTEQNVDAFTERNIYDAYHMEAHTFAEEAGYHTEHTYRCIAKGKYFWDPEREEFSLFLKSVHHAVLELLKTVEEKWELYDEDLQQQLRFPHQVKLFELIGQQYIKPLHCLQKLADPDFVDDAGRAIYRFRALVGSKNNSEVISNIKALKPGVRLYPDALQNNRILVSDGQRRSLGALSLEEDELYFCLIPLIRTHQAQVKMTVEKVEQSRKQKDAKAYIQLLVRVSEKEVPQDKDANAKIRKVISQYEQQIKQY